MIRSSLLIAGLVALTGCAQMMQSAGMDPNAVKGGSDEPGEAPGAPETATDATPGAEDDKADDKADAPPAGPSTVSVTIKSDCKDTVKVFYGKKPKFGSGRYSTVSSNSRSSHTFKPGEMFWIVDDSQAGVSSVTIEDGTKEVSVGCDKLAAR